MNIAILVVTYNRKNLLYENISAIRKQSYIKYDYYICDNASTDGTHQIVAHADVYKRQGQCLLLTIVPSAGYVKKVLS